MSYCSNIVDVLVYQNILQVSSYSYSDSHYNSKCFFVVSSVSTLNVSFFHCSNFTIFNLVTSYTVLQVSRSCLSFSVNYEYEYIFVLVLSFQPKWIHFSLVRPRPSTTNFFKARPQLFLTNTRFLFYKNFSIY